MNLFKLPTLFAALVPLLFVSAGQQDKSTQAQLEQIESAIHGLSGKLHALRLEVMQDEISSQSLMFERWEEYANRLKDEEKLQHEIDSLEEQIRALQTQRNSLLQIQSSQSSKS